MLLNKKKIIIVLVYLSFFIAIPIVKNESRLIEKNLLEANLEFQYLTSPAVLSSQIEKYFNQKYNNLDLSQIYINIEDFVSEQQKITRVSSDEKQKQ